MRVARQTVRRMVQVWLALVGLMLTFGLMLAAQGARRHSEQQAAARSLPPPATPPLATGGLPALDGSTGTVALPALPIPPGASPTDQFMVAARPFRWGSATAIDRARAMQCLTAAIYYEASGESIDGQRAVAQVVLNRARHPAFPGTVCGVVYQGMERVHCQFSFVCDGALARRPSVDGWARAARIAASALSGNVFAAVGLATHYHTFAVAPSWNRAMVMTDMVGAHLFHRWKGYWGTAAAMNRAYSGGEVLPIPPATDSKAATASGAPSLDPKALAVPPTLAINASVAAPPAPHGRKSAPSPDAISGTVISDRLARSGEILDKWKDSGRPIERPDGPRPSLAGAAPVTDQRR